MYLIWLQACSGYSSPPRHSIEDAVIDVLQINFNAISRNWTWFAVWACASTNMALFTQVVINCTDRIRIGSHCLTRYSDNMFNTQMQAYMHGVYVLCTSYYNPINANWKHHILHRNEKKTHTGTAWLFAVMCMAIKSHVHVHNTYVIKSASFWSLHKWQMMIANWTSCKFDVTMYVKCQLLHLKYPVRVNVYRSLPLD